MICLKLLLGKQAIKWENVGRSEIILIVGKRLDAGLGHYQ
jgi:hypothetical protein